MLDSARPIELYDDRSKTDERLRVTQILYEDDEVLLVRARFDEDASDERLLIGKVRGEVLTSNFEFWYAENV